MLKHMTQKKRPSREGNALIQGFALISGAIILALLHIYLYLFTYVPAAIDLAGSKSKEILHTSNDKT